MKFHQEGIVFFITSAAITALGFVINQNFFLIMLLITGAILFFFRDPDRIMPDLITPDGKHIILSPCDGIITEIKNDEYQGINYIRISIFLNFYDVHVNRIPLSGKITEKIHKLGKFNNFGDKNAVANHENIMLKIEGPITILIKQIAGLFARRVICYADKGDEVQIGNRYGIIKFGSRVDMFLPNTVELNVKKGQTSIGGETIIAFFRQQGIL